MLCLCVSFSSVDGSAVTGSQFSKLIEYLLIKLSNLYASLAELNNIDMFVLSLFWKSNS